MEDMEAIVVPKIVIYSSQVLPTTGKPSPNTPEAEEASFFRNYRKYLQEVES